MNINAYTTPSVVVFSILIYNCIIGYIEKRILHPVLIFRPGKIQIILPFYTSSFLTADVIWTLTKPFFSPSLFATMWTINIFPEKGGDTSLRNTILDANKDRLSSMSGMYRSNIKITHFININFFSLKIRYVFTTVSLKSPFFISVSGFC